MNKRYKILLLLILVILFFLAFTLPLNPPAGEWTQQFMPDLGGRQIQDIEFVDSLLGFASARQNFDTSYILRTTNGGDNWQIICRSFLAIEKIQFLNSYTGYACGAYVFSTTNGGLNWTAISTGLGVSAVDFYVFNNDTIWFVDDNSLTGGVFRTINGGINWTRQANFGLGNPNKIYMYNRNFGFASEYTGTILYRTINSGVNWDMVSGADGFYDMKFADNLTGWKAKGTVKKTTDGGLSWIQQTLPSGGIILNNSVNKISLINEDTIWGVGGSVFYGSGQFRGILFRTINGGENWFFQIPDTVIHLDYYIHIQFINRTTGWAYRPIEGGIHTTIGGDTSWLTGVHQISSEIPKQFKLFQNYPNPFNPKTIISYELPVTSYVALSVFDITGKKVVDLVNQKQNAGKNQIDFSGNGLSSGVYFYKIQITSGKEVLIDTKKMILLK